MSYLFIQKTSVKITFVYFRIPNPLSSDNEHLMLHYLHSKHNFTFRTFDRKSDSLERETGYEEHVNSLLKKPCFHGSYS